MKLSCTRNKNYYKNHDSFSRQWRSFSERNFQGAIDSFSRQWRSFSEMNFQGALLLEKETLK